MNYKRTESQVLAQPSPYRTPVQTPYRIYAHAYRLKSKIDGALVSFALCHFA
jgi:hypothetical protein